MNELPKFNIKKEIRIISFKKVSAWTIGQMARNGWEVIWDYDNHYIIFWRDMKC